MRTFTFSLLMLLAGLAVAQMPTQGLVAYLPMNGNATDNQGFFENFVTRPTNATVSPFADRLGSASGACSFNADAYYKDSVSSGTMPDTAFTIAAWIYPTQYDLYSTIFGIRLSDVTTTYNSIWLGLLSNGTVHCAMTNTGNTATQQTITSASIVQQLTWTHVAVSYSSGEGMLKVYLNGELNTSVTVFQGEIIYPTSPTFVIGNQLSTIGTELNGHKFVGAMDEFALYNRALTASEISTFAVTASAAPTAAAPAVRLLPNPARDVVQVQTAVHVQSIRLLDLTGKLVREATTATVEVADLPAGLYLMQVHTAQGMAVERFVKE